MYIILYHSVVSLLLNFLRHAKRRANSFFLAVLLFRLGLELSLFVLFLGKFVCELGKELFFFGRDGKSGIQNLQQASPTRRPGQCSRSRQPCVFITQKRKAGPSVRCARFIASERGIGWQCKQICGRNAAASAGGRGLLGWHRLGVFGVRHKASFFCLWANRSWARLLKARRNVGMAKHCP